MIKITTKSTKEKQIELIDPCKMLNTEYGTVFQQYVNDKPVKDFYISCGQAELAVIHIWYNDEDKRQELSTDDLKSLRGLKDHVKVRKIDAVVEMNIIT